MTKQDNANNALKQLIDNNQLTMTTKAWVDRENDEDHQHDGGGTRENGRGMVENEKNGDCGTTDGAAEGSA